MDDQQRPACGDGAPCAAEGAAGIPIAPTVPATTPTAHVRALWGAAPAALHAKLDALAALLRALAPATLGFSGGVDSTFLATVCRTVIPGETVLVHLNSPFVATPEQTSSAALSQSLGLPVVTIDFDPFTCPDVAANEPDRCYRCKRAGFERIIAVARAHGCRTVLDGSNADDAAATDRPGMRALRELGVRSPLMETGWTKAEERAVLRAWGIAIWNMPAGACLATRVATGEPLTPQKLEVIRTCEDYLHSLGCTQVRARIAAGTVRIEAAAEDLALIADADGALKAPVLARLGALARDVARIGPAARPYRRGSMNL